MKELSLTHIVLLYLAGINMVTFFMYTPIRDKKVL